MNVLLRWPEVNWDARTDRQSRGRAAERVTVPITDTIREILWPLRGHHAEIVFTYVAKRTREATESDQGRSDTRSPTAASRSAWKRHQGGRPASPISGSTTTATTSRPSCLRETGNLKLVQKALNHRRHQDHDEVRPRPGRRSGGGAGSNPEIPKKVPKTNEQS